MTPTAGPRMHFIEADLREDWFAAIDWDAVVTQILVLGMSDG
jgi:hypothetical protein